MATINNYFEQAELSLAAYALNLQAGMSGSSANSSSYIASLIAANMTSTQATDFANTYTVLAQSAPDPDGFSATLFLNNQTHEKTLAIQGTANIPGVVTDIANVAILGSVQAQGQYVSLNNFYQQLITQGTLAPNERISVTGHSLGGFLAQAFSIDNPLTVNQTYTYNAPGIGGVVSEVLSWLGVTNTSISVGNITNIQASGLSATAGLGTMLGNVQNIFTEVQSNPLSNHKIGFLTDSLAVYNLFAQLDPTLNSSSTGLNSITDILQASSNVAANSLESVVSVFGKLFNVPSAVVTGNALDGSNRDLLYKALDDITSALKHYNTNTPPAQPNYNFTVRDLTTFNASQLASVAQGSLAYRYALVNLNSFAVLGNDSIYTQFDTNGQLDMSVAFTGAGCLTTQYLQDRAAMLSVLMQRNIQDVTFAPYPDSVIYSDAASGIILRPSNASHLGDNAFQQVVFGADGKTLYGGGKDDHLYAGTGSETLNGGAGNDSYYIEANQNCADTIFDSDGKGSVWVGSTQLTGKGAVYKGNGLWVDTNGTKYQFDQDKSTLIITSGNDTITINDFKNDPTNGYLGIKLPNQVSVTADISTKSTVTGNQAIAVSNGNVKSFTVAIATVSDKIQTLRLQLAEYLADAAWKLINGAQTLSFNSNGTVDITIPAGQSSVTLALLDTSGTNKADTATLTATTKDTSGNIITSNTLAVTFDSPGAASSTVTPAHTITGGFDPSSNLGGAYATDSLGNIIPSTTADPGFQDMLWGSGSNDLITTGNGGGWVMGMGGNDTIVGMSGPTGRNDGSYNPVYILTGDAFANNWRPVNGVVSASLMYDQPTISNQGDKANDVITANGGLAFILAGNGNNQIYANKQVDLATALAGQKSATGWGVIAAGDGNNTIVGGSNEPILVGTGNNTIVCGPGKVTLVEGVENVTITQVGSIGATNTPAGPTFSNISFNSAAFNAPSNYHGTTVGGVAVGVGNDTIYGGPGDSYYGLSNGNNWLDAGGGNDTIQAGVGNNTIFGGVGNDVITGGGGNNYINLESGSDTVILNGGNNTGGVLFERIQCAAANDFEWRIAA